jgi:hypothetical protein
VTSAPPKFLQKINEGIGIVLIAISGPDVPIPRIPIPSRIKSLCPGIAVWLWMSDLSVDIGQMYLFRAI